MALSLRHPALAFLSTTALSAALALGASPAFAGGGKDELKLLPKDSAGVVVVNVEQLNRSPLFQDLLKMALANPDAQKGLAEMRQKLGTDPFTAVKTIAVALPAGLQGPGVAAVTMTGDLAKLEAAAVQAGLNGGKESLGGYTLLKNSGGDQGVALGAGHVLIGPLPALKATIGPKAKGGTLDKNSEIMKLVGAAPQGRDVWFAIKADPKSTAPGMAHAKNIKGGVEMEKGVDILVQVSMDSADEAKKVVDAAKKDLDQLKTQPQAKLMGLEGLVGKVSMVQKGADLEIKIPLDEADVAKLKATVGMMMMMAGAAAKGAPAMAPPPGMGGPGLTPMKMPLAPK